MARKMASPPPSARRAIRMTSIHMRSRKAEIRRSDDRELTDPGCVISGTRPQASNARLGQCSRMSPDSLAMSAALEVPVVAAEIEGERERDNCLGYGGSDVVAVDVLVELQRPPDHGGWKT